MTGLGQDSDIVGGVEAGLEWRRIRECLRWRADAGVVCCALSWCCV